MGLVGPLLRRHLDGSDLLAAYPDLLDDPALAAQMLRGYLTGSIDAVLRIWREDQPRYLVVDYKTNWLGALDAETLTIGDYTPARMAEAMMSAHYPLQALLYAVALHRMLRWRQPGYDPAVHLGGVLYLFVRGMAGPETPARRRRAVRRLQLAAATGAGRRAVGPPRRSLAMSRARAIRARCHSTAAGLLAPFSLAGVLNPADVHTAETVCRIGGESDESVRLALALTVRALRNGSVCIDLGTVHATAFDEAESAIDVAELPWPEPDAWSRGVRKRAHWSLMELPSRAGGRCGWRRAALSGAVLAAGGTGSHPAAATFRCAGPGDRPSTAVDGLAQTVRPRRLGADEADRQQLAAAVSALGRVSVLAGGPGTGKTTTVARLLALLRDQPGPELRIALAAPTGKAAARLEEAVRAATAELSPDDQQRLGDLSASTLHRLLGWLPSSRSRFRHDASNPLPHDVVIVDEMSMVSLTMMARLLEAVRPSARLVLVGDPDQLSSVEAGAVLADIARAPGVPEADLGRRLVELGLIADGEAPPVHGVVQLTHTWRFGGSINELAKAIRAADPDAAIAVLRAGANDVQFREVDLESDPTAASSGLLADMAAAGTPGRCGHAGSRPYGRHSRRAGRSGPASPAVRASARAVRSAALGFRGRALAGGVHSRLRRGG